MENLNNNHESMKTVVETFLIEENLELIYDSEKLEKWNNLVTQLGLEGQSNLIKPDKSPVPFMHMKSSLKNVFETLCPRKSKIKAFNITPIPLEILDLIALSEREGYFSNIEIWYDEKAPDPVCVGIIEHWVLHQKGSYNVIPGSPDFNSKQEAENFLLINNLVGDAYHYSWGEKQQYYLIGKWADVCRSIDELKQMAIDRYIEAQSTNLKQTMKDTQRKLDDLESEAKQRFN